MSAATEALGTIGQRLLQHVDDLCAEQCRLIRKQVDAYRTDEFVSDDELFGACRSHAVFVLDALGSGSADTAPAREVGRRRAEQGVPLAEVMSAYRIGSHFWSEQVAKAVEASGISRRGLLLAMSEAWQNQTEYTDAMATAYRETMTAQLVQRSQERSALVGGLLDGRLPPQVTAWDAARLLGLPESRYFAVVAIELGAGDFGTTPQVENVLRNSGVPSAWRLEPDMEVGIVALSAANQLTRLRPILVSHTTRSVGVSPLYDHLPPPGEALTYATAALRATTETDRVVAFDEDPYAVAAVSAPQTLHRFADLVLGNLTDDDRTVLIDTFMTWVSAGGGVEAAARELCCHPNTVRYRLRRLSDHTGRDVLRPRGVAEVLLAVEATRRLR